MSVAMRKPVRNFLLELACAGAGHLLQSSSASEARTQTATSVRRKASIFSLLSLFACSKFGQLASKLLRFLFFFFF